MKKIRYKLIIIFILTLLIAGLTACKKDTLITVTYIDGNEQLKTIEINKGSSLDSLHTPPEKTGFVFEGWFTDKEHKNRFIPTAAIKDNLSLYAKYTPKIFTITFKSQGNEDIIRKVEYNKNLLDIPTVPTKTGYTGVWNKTEFNNIASDLTVTAIYTPITLTITFKNQGQQDIIKTVLYGQDLTDIPSVVQKEGKIGAWDITDFTDITQNLIVNAVYQDIIITITFISINPDDNTQIFETKRFVNYGKTFSIVNRPQPHAFQGHNGVWEETSYDNLKQDLTVYAIYERINLNITFLPLSGQEITVVIPYGAIPYDYIQDRQPEEINITQQQKEELLNPVFPDGLDNPQSRNVRYGNTNSDVFLPVYQENSFNVIWDLFVTIIEALEDTIHSQTQLTVTYRTYISPPDLEHKLGYKFKNWYNEIEAINQFSFSNAIEEDTTIYAKWEQVFCEICFPSIEGISFIHEYTQKLPYGSYFRFAIDTNLNILEVRANQNILTKDQNDYYIINSIEDDLNIAVKTNEIDIYMLTFIDSLQSKTIYTRSVSAGQLLLSVPPVPERQTSLSSWQYNGEDFDFATQRIYSNITFYSKYIDLTYSITYVLSSDNTRFQQVSYQDEEFEFYSPPRQENLLFDGWYLDEELSVRATKSYVINLGNHLFLYPKWMPQKDISTDIIGLWHGELFLLELYSNGMAQIYDKDTFIECSFSVSDSYIYIMDEEGTYDGNNILFRNKQLQKTNQQKTFVFLNAKDLMIIDNYTLPYDEEIFQLYWYTEYDCINIIDITQPIDSKLFQNRMLYLYSNTNRRIRINFNPMEGYTDGNITHMDLFVMEGIVLSQSLIKAHLTNYVFRCWAIENTNQILSLHYILNNYQPEINVYAVYTEQSHQTENAVEGIYNCIDNNNMYIAEFSYNEDEDYYYYTITVINLIENTFTLSIPFIYTWNSENQYTDEHDNFISVTDTELTLVFNDKNLTFQLNSVDISGEIYRQTVVEDDTTTYNLISFDTEAGEIRVNNDAYPAYQHNNMIYYFLMQTEMLIMYVVDLNSLEEVSAQIPAQHLGNYQCELSMEGDEPFFISLNISIPTECVLEIYYDSQRENLGYSSTSGFAEDINGNYIIIEFSEFAFKIDETNNKYYLVVNLMEVELIKIDL